MVPPTGYEQDKRQRLPDLTYTIIFTSVVTFVAMLVAAWIFIIEPREAARAPLLAPTPRFEPVAIGGGQNVTYMSYGQLIPWAKANPDAKIVHLIGVTDRNGETFQFFVVYTLEPE